MGPLRVLLVEDSEDDALLLTRQLERHAGGADVLRVWTLPALRAALDSGARDVVVSDYRLQGFTGLEALEIVRAHASRLPFVLVSAALGEETAVAAMRAGASDFVMKARPGRLLPAVEREVREARLRLEHEVRIARMARVRAVSGAANAAMLRVRDRDELHAEACRIAAEDGGFPVALSAVSDGGVLRTVASRGSNPVLAALMGAPGSPLGAAILGAITEERTAVWNELGEGRGPPDGPALVDAGVRSLAALPVSVPGAFSGALILGAAEPGFFDEEEVRLLRGLAADIAFTLDHIDQRERLEHLALHDTVTGLANRRLFDERLAQRLAAVPGDPLAVCVLHAGRMTEINATLGRHAGDALLRVAAARLAAIAGKANVARIGASEFALILPHVQGESEAAQAVREGIGTAFDESLVFEGHEARLVAHVGVALYPEDGSDPGRLVRNAEAAAVRATAAAEGLLFYDVGMTTRAAGRLKMEGELRRALELGQFELFYQPKVSASTRAIVGVEALLRWRHPQLGLTSPARFVPLLEETGLIVEVGDWIFREAAAQVRRWRGLVAAAPRCAVNVSVRQLGRADFVQRLEAGLGGGNAGVDLEIVESLAMADPDACVAKLTAASELGARVFVDDFGTGYSSLAYLTRLPVHGVKIDRSFTAAMLGDAQARALVSTIVALANTLGLDSVAEGVETEEQAQALRALGCGQLQGYLTGRPVPAEEFAALLTRASGS